MRLFSWLLCATALIVPAFTSEENIISRPKRDSSEKKIVCYYTNWSVYRPGTAKFTPQNINPYLCTHLIYAFGGLSKDNALKPFDKYQDIEQGGYAKFNGLKTYNKNLKTILAIGGWNEGSARFSPLVADPERRRELVKNTVKFLRQNHFDGLDLDWEYPSFRDGGKPRDRDNYATLVQEFREEFERESEKTGRARLLLTMAVPAGIEYIDKGYDVPKLNRYLDWMNILSYDYHSAFEPAINHHSPLFSLEEDDEYNFDAVLNIDHTIQHYIKLGADKSKLVLGIPTYGRSYTLFNPDATDIGSPADGPGEQGEATREKGYLAYYEICERVKSGGWTLENPNPEAMGPYAYKENQWVGFDDEDIVRLKAKYVNDNDLGGIMFWSIDNDDFRGKCHGKPYPLIEAAKESLLANANELAPRTRSGSSRSQLKKQDQETPTKSKTRKTRLRTKSSTTTESSQTKPSSRTSTTPQPPTTPDPGSDFVCKDEGFFPHPRDCKKYFWCLDSGPSSLGIVAHQFTCPSGLVFNKISDSCDYARNVICKTKAEPAATTTTTTTTTSTPRTTTTRNRLVITASPPRTTTTTTTEPPSEEREAEEDEEDPGTIKELINLIKKLGGVEQLEKQLNLQNSDDKEKINSSLYSRVLQGRTANRYRGVTGETSTAKYVPPFRNRPVGPQSPSTEDISSTTRGSEKPRYVTIQRNRSTMKPVTVNAESQEEEEEEAEEQSKQPVQETPRSFRRRPTTDATTEKEYVILRRSRPQAEDDVFTPKYKNIVRLRSTTEAVEPEVEEDHPQEEEEIAEEEEETEEIEPPQKLKKYSSIIRDNKKIMAEEEELKVSGPQGQGPQYGSGVSSSTTNSVLDGRNNVYNVNIVTSPRYVEIRRTHPTPTEPTESNVHNVNNSYNNTQENVNETNEVYENQPEERESSVKGFQRKTTTEITKRPTRPIFRSSTLVSTTPITFEASSNKINNHGFRERFSTISTTEAAPIISVKPIHQYKTLNRNDVDKKINGFKNENNKLPGQEKIFRNPITTVETPSTNEALRRFQFAPRTKPAILLPKAPEPTTEVFQITVPNVPSLDSTEKNVASSFPSVTLEPTTLPNIDSTILTGLEDNAVLTTFRDEKLASSIRDFIPTTSTQTSVVTSITESSYTERKRIFVPRKTRLRSESELSLTTEYPFDTTKAFFRAPVHKIITTPRAEPTTETRKRRFKTKSTTTTTTEKPSSAKKYVAKKIKNFKRITSSETPEVSSTTTERYRFLPRNKPRHAEGGPLEPSDLLQSRFKTGRKKKFLSKKEEDDLEVQQTATFFDDDFESNDRYILGGALKQSSEKDYFNADVLLRAVPTVEEEENLAQRAPEELTNSENKIAVTPVYPSNKTDAAERRESIRNRFFTTNNALRKLKSRTRQTSENSSVSEADVNRNLLQRRDKETTKTPSVTSNQKAFKALRGRTQPNNSDRVVNNTQENAERFESKLGETEFVQSQRQRKLRPDLRNGFSGISKSVQSVDKAGGGGFGTKATNKTVGVRKFKARIRQDEFFNQRSAIENVPSEENLEVIKSNIISRSNSSRKSTEPSKNSETRVSISSRITNRLFIGNVDEKEKKEAVPASDLARSTPSSSVHSTAYSSQIISEEGSTSVETTSNPLFITNTKAQHFNDFTLTDYRPRLTTAKTQSEKVTQKEDFTTATKLDSLFGTKIGVTVGSTSAIISTTNNPVSPTSGKIRGAYITVAPKVASPKSNETRRTNFKAKDNDGVKVVGPKTKESLDNDEVKLNSSSFRSLRTKIRQNSGVESRVLEKPLKNNSDSNRIGRTRGKIKALDSIFQATEIGSVNETVTEGRNGKSIFLKGRKVLVRRPVQSTPEIKEEENELEPPEETPITTAKTTSDKRVTQEQATNFRSRGRSSTQSTVGNERTETKRIQLDRRRFRGESRSPSLKPEVQKEISSSTSRANILLRRKTRPSTTTTTTSTTEEPYVEQQEDSRLEESKSLDEVPGIQDLADPAVVAIHNLATVSPGPLASAITSSLNSYSQTPATYTVHVTPADIASFSTPINIASVTPGSVSSRPTSILTLKPYTVPLITRQYITKQTPAPFRSVSPFKGTSEAGIPSVTKESDNPRSEILIQSRKQETTQRVKPAAFIASKSEKEAEPKARRLKPFSKVPKQEVAQSASSSEPPVDYEYYDDDEDPLANIPASALKVKVHSDGYIECLDRGNFPHPFSCKKFISCAKMENNELLGWEYTCPKHLSFDPVGGICNWSAGLGCQH